MYVRCQGHPSHAHRAALGLRRVASCWMGLTKPQHALSMRRDGRLGVRCTGTLPSTVFTVCVVLSSPPSLNALQLRRCNEMARCGAGEARTVSCCCPPPAAHRRCRVLCCRHLPGYGQVRLARLFDPQCELRAHACCAVWHCCGCADCETHPPFARTSTRRRWPHHADCRARAQIREAHGPGRSAHHTLQRTQLIPAVFLVKYRGLSFAHIQWVAKNDADKLNFLQVSSWQAAACLIPCSRRSTCTPGF